MIIHISDLQKVIKLDRRQIRSDIRTALKILNVKDKEVSLVFMDNDGIQEINRDYLNRDRPTNVISFAIGEGEFGSLNPQLLGDIIVSTERALSDAKQSDIPFTDEMAFLIIHGLLHLIGFDHEGVPESEATLMKQKEQELFSVLRGYNLDLS
jgi:probable rRNA maturation factor